MKRFSLKEIANLTGATLVGDPNYLISSVDALDTATAADVSFLANPRYRDLIHTSQAGAICIDSSTSPLEGKNFLISDNPSRTFQQVLELFLNADYHQSAFQGIHSTVVIHSTAKIGKDVQIGPYAVIDQHAEIGDNTQIASHVSIGPGVKIGNNCRLHAHVVIRERCQIGDRVILQPGAIIGSCGFGYTTDAKGVHTKLEQLGTVIIEDDVEIGAATTIDRARFKETRIAKGTKIDNLVQIGHNVHIGPHNILVSQAGVAGSVKTGRNVILGGQAGVVGHLELADGVMIASRGGVSKSLTKTGKYAGAPVQPIAEHNRQQVLLRKIETYVSKIEHLEKALEALELKSVNK